MATAVMVCFARSASAQEESVDGPVLVAQAEVLVEQLGSEDFGQREGAAEQLVEMGFAAAEAVEQGTHHIDREIRYRCKRIIQLIAQIDRQEKIDAFLAGTLDEDTDALPGWSSFQEVIGDDEKSRELFVVMLEEEWNLLRLLQDHPTEASNGLSDRCQDINNAKRIFQQQVSLGSVCTLVFLAGEPDVEVADRLVGSLYEFCFQPAFRLEVEGGSRQEMTKKLLGRWVGRTGAGAYSSQILMLSMRFDLEEGIGLAVETLQQQEGITFTRHLVAHVTQCALLAVAQFGNEEEHAALLEGLFDDDALCTQQNLNGKMYQTEVRDIALACRIHLAGESPGQFGFDRIQPNVQMLYNTSTLGFENNEERQEAFDRWKEVVESSEEDSAPAEVAAPPS